ncbi:MAG: hypothetical protein KGJ88_00920 [Verrucomicrobiota bacterium]|nr:hypothetical protein [Verrucomicrobiota bacterium]
MNYNPQPQAPAGLAIGDIYYILFRHKRKILLFALAGLAAAAWIRFRSPPPYESQAELLVKYVPVSSASAIGSDQRMIVPDAEHGADVMDSEVQILTSLDVAETAATNIAAAKPVLFSILAGGKGGNPIRAGLAIRNGLAAAPSAKGSSVIVVTFQHRDFRIVQPVLQEVIADYIERQHEIHQATAQMDDQLAAERDALRSQLDDTERRLSTLKNNANILSLGGSETALAQQISKIQGAILDAQAQLAGNEAVLQKVGQISPSKLEMTNAAVVPPEQMDRYLALCAQLDTLRKKDSDYFAGGYTSSNLLVVELQGQITRLQQSKISMEKSWPQLAGLGAPSRMRGQTTAAAAAANPQSEVAQVVALRAKIKAWNDQLAQLQTEATNLNNLAPIIAQLDQTRGILTTNINTLSASLQQAQINEALATGSAPNIRIVQSPSPPFRDWKKSEKIMAALAVAGAALGIGLAFLLELFLDPTVKRPVEITSKLKLPLFLSIPDVAPNGGLHLPWLPERRLLRQSNEDNANPAQSTGKNGQVEILSPDKNPALQPFYEALRDRLVLHFETRKLTHKPKLVAVTGASRGAGASTVAAGLAASLSETGDGNVLLVDMNIEHGAARQFYKGRAGCALDAALAMETKQSALVQENLYVVTGQTNSNSEKLPRILPRRFAALVPRLKASDFDYIIFDMPPVSPTSVTARLSGYMDTVLLTVESEKSATESVRHAASALAEAGATVSVVLNKTRCYVPKRLGTT